MSTDGNRLVATLQAAAPSISFEFFPPRDDAGEAVLWQAIRRLEPLAPSFVSVTYGAGGSTRDRTVRVTAELAAHTSLSPVAHLTCVGASRAELRQVIGAYAAAGVGTVMALRGDPPGGPGQPWTAHPHGLDHAIDLVRLVKETSSLQVGVAAFPDRHPESPDLEHDARVLLAKAEAGADFAVTQFFFDPAAYFGLVDRLARLGGSLPILPGIMPVTALAQLPRFSTLTGVDLPESARRRLQERDGDPAGVRAVGLDLAVELGRQLLDGGAPGLHFYTLNTSTATLELAERLGLARHPVLSS